MVSEDKIRREQEAWAGESFPRKLYWQLRKLAPFDWFALAVIVTAALACWFEVN